MVDENAESDENRVKTIQGASSTDPDHEQTVNIKVNPSTHAVKVEKA